VSKGYGGGVGVGRLIWYAVRSGKESWRFRLPDGWSTTEIAPRRVSPLRDPAAVLADRLARPLDSPPLEHLARGGRSVAVAVPDVTRPSLDSVFLPPIIATLLRAGVRTRDITIVVATGLHRSVTVQEMRSRYAAAFDAGIRVVNHQADDPDLLVDLGSSPEDIPIKVDKRIVNADLVMATGIVEPHQFAGFSGGYKTIAVGCAGEETIAASHDPRFLSQPGVVLGELEANPFQTLIRDIASRAKMKFSINGIVDEEGRVVAAEAGEPGAVLGKLADRVRQTTFHPVERSFDLIITGAPYPKDQNLYQTSRVVTYLLSGASPLLKPGGALFVGARCPEGAGGGKGERQFYECMAGAETPQAALESLLSGGVRGGGQRAFFLARALMQGRVMLIGASCPQVAKRVHINVAENMEDALREADLSHRSSLEVLIVRDVFKGLPIKEIVES